MINISDFEKKKERICIIGLGYVGLPLAVLLNKKYSVTGFDKSEARINDLKNNIDKTREIEKDVLRSSTIELTADPEKISECRLVIVTVPTPIDANKRPDLSIIHKATETVGKYLKQGSVIVYESTVYPGVTEEICVPILEAKSGYKWKKDFNVGYSPERVNPGDKNHTIDKIAKVISGDNEHILEFLAGIYGSVITAEIHKAPTIKTAEAAKVIENTQRDLNIALMNELSVIFDKKGIDTAAVLKAAGTKWNFLKFYPGLVGGHCIGVDPYYLTFLAESLNYHPEVILAGRRINDNLGKYIAGVTVKSLINSGYGVKGSKILILGITFKENIADIRNSKVIDIYSELKEYGAEVFLTDPYAYQDEVKEMYEISLIDDVDKYKPYDAVIYAVNHKAFYDMYNLAEIKSICSTGSPVLIDIRRTINEEDAKDAGFSYWGL